MSDNDIIFEEKVYAETGSAAVFEYFEDGEKWIQLKKAEGMLSTSYRSLDRYIKALSKEDNYDVLKVKRKPTSVDHPFTFMRESDVNKIADKFNKKVRWELKEIHTLDRNHPAFSRNDFDKIKGEAAKKLINDSGNELIEGYKSLTTDLQNQINKLESKNSTLENKVDELDSDYRSATEEKHGALNSLELSRSEFRSDNSKLKLAFLSTSGFLIFCSLALGAYSFSSHQSLLKSEKLQNNTHVKLDNKIIELQETNRLQFETKAQLELSLTKNQEKEQQISILKDQVDSIKNKYALDQFSGLTGVFGGSR